MPFFFLLSIFIIRYCSNNSANFDKGKINYFVNKEIYDSIIEKDENLLPDTGKIKTKKIANEF